MEGVEEGGLEGRSPGRVPFHVPSRVPPCLPRQVRDGNGYGRQKQVPNPQGLRDPEGLVLGLRQKQTRHSLDSPEMGGGLRQRIGDVGLPADLRDPVAPHPLGSDTVLRALRRSPEMACFGSRLPEPNKCVEAAQEIGVDCRVRQGSGPHVPTMHRCDGYHYPAREKWTLHPGDEPTHQQTRRHGGMGPEPELQQAEGDGEKADSQSPSQERVGLLPPDHVSHGGDPEQRKGRSHRREPPQGVPETHVEERSGLLQGHRHGVGPEEKTQPGGQACPCQNQDHDKRGCEGCASHRPGTPRLRAPALHPGCQAEACCQGSEYEGLKPREGIVHHLHAPSPGGGDGQGRRDGRRHEKGHGSLPRGMLRTRPCLQPERHCHDGSIESQPGPEGRSQGEGGAQDTRPPHHSPSPNGGSRSSPQIYHAEDHQPERLHDMVVQPSHPGIGHCRRGPSDAEPCGDTGSHPPAARQNHHAAGHQTPQHGDAHRPDRCR